MVISTHDGQIYEDDVDWHLDRPMEGSKPLRVTITPHMDAGESNINVAQNSEERLPGGFSKASPEEIEGLKYNSPMVSHKDPDWERGAPAVQELLDVPQEEYDKQHEEWKQLEREGKATLGPNAKPMEAGVFQMRKDFPATQDYLKYIQKYNPQDVDAYDAGDFVIFKKRPSAPPLVGQQEDHKLFFVRHGETEDNEENVIRTKDTQLTDTGRKQVEVAAKQLKSEGVDAIVSSNLPRAKESAHIIAAKLGIVPQFDNQLNTWDMGKLEGQPCDTTNTKLMKDAVEKTPDEPVGGGESFNQFKDRSQAGIRDAINNNQGKKLAILTHSKVENTLKAWEATGQDNPSIDPKIVSKAADKPGSVEPFTMQANSTIMTGQGEDFSKAPEMGLNSEVFKERFGDYWKENLPMSSQTDKGEVPGWWQYGPKPSRQFREMDRQQRRQELQRQLNPTSTESDEGDVPGIKPLGKYTPTEGIKLYPGKGPTPQSDTPLGRYFQGMGDTLAEQLMSIIQHPENMVGPGELGMAKGMPPSFLNKSKSYKDLFDTLIKRPEIVKDEIIKSDPKRTGRGIGTYQAPSIASPNLPPQVERNPEYEKALSEWMKNQFEGGPIEGEKYSKTPEDFNIANRDVTQLQRPANENKNLDLGTGGFDYDAAWANLKKILNRPELKSIQGGKGQSPEMQKLLQENPGMSLETAQEILDLLK